MTKIKGPRARFLLGKGALMYDMRDAVAFRDGTLPGAKHLVLRQVSSLFALPKNTHIILFGHGYDDPDVLSAFSYLTQSNYVNLYNLGSMDNY